MPTHDLLFEIGCEELPESAQFPLAKALANNLTAAFEKSALTHGKVEVFATPRRLAVIFKDMISEQPAKQVERRGPSTKAAFDSSGSPTLACMGFAKSCNVSIEELEIKKTDKGEWVCCTVNQPGVNSAELIPDLIQAAIKKLPIPKPMRWGNNDFSFIRPVHWIVLLFGNDVIDAEILGKKTNRETRGHRFHHPKALRILNPSDYTDILFNHGGVIADYEKRQSRIKQLIDIATKDYGRAKIDPDLLFEVTALVEWPECLVGKFDERFLKIPAEVLVTSMKSHQKCFSVADKSGKLLPNFVHVANIKSKNPAAIIEGVERVINARLTDAEFFYHNDLKHSLDSRFERLETVVFQEKLGSIADKARRMSELNKWMAKKVNVEHKDAKSAAHLAKCDLVSEMVYEFPELQGIMGAYYAANDELPKAVCAAIEEHYAPRFAGDTVPASDLGAITAIADKLDSIVGIFGINQKPTGDKDPFALRRAALGVVRILLEKQYHFNLRDLLEKTYDNFECKFANKNTVEDALHFMMERLKAWYLEQDVTPQIFAAVFNTGTTDLSDFAARISAVQNFQQLPEAESLAAANKRVSNILKKQEKLKLPEKIDVKFFENDTEKNLYKLINEQGKQIKAHCKNAEYTTALTELANLQKPIDQFFDEIMVMVDDTKVRNNRLLLLKKLRELFMQVADISELQV